MNLIQTLKLFYAYIKPNRRMFVWGIIALFGVDLLNVFPPLILKNFIDHAAQTLRGDKDWMPFLWMGLIYAVIAVGQGFFRYLWRMLLIKGSHKAAEKIREEYFEKLQKLPPSFYDRNSIGDLMSLATNDSEAIRFALGPGLLVLADAVFFLITIPPAMIWLSGKLSLYSLIPMLFVPFVIVWVEKRIHHWFEKVQGQFSKLSAFAQENIEGVRVIKSLTREWTQALRFNSIGKEFVRLNMKLTKVQSIFEPLFILVTTLGLVFLLVFCGSDVISGAIGLGTFVAFTRYLEQLVWPMMAFGLAVTYYERGKTSLMRIAAVLDEKEEKDINDLSWTSEVSEERTPLLEARNLTFYYPGEEKPALENINFKLEKGSRTALLGLVGSGKTTLVKLLLGLYNVEPGMLFWKGRDMALLPLANLRSEITVAPQDVFLFRESLQWNVLLGVEKSLHKEATLKQVLIKAGLGRELESWNLGKPIDERGLNLSVGQKARVALARALIIHSDLLILDDALSSVDIHTERDILSHLELDHQTLLMVTHRLTGLWKFNQILVFKNGRLVEEGSPQNLARSQGLYHQIMELQRIENELAG